MRCTVFGGSGFIGKCLVNHLRKNGFDVDVPDKSFQNFAHVPLGHVFFCIGLTADFRQRPFDAVEAHVTYLSRLLEVNNFDSFLYLSSTRIYSKSVSTAENISVQVNPFDPSDLYNISKLMGESICLASSLSKIKIARLSNVIGMGMGAKNFLGLLIHEALQGKVVLQTNPDSQKDYILLDDAVGLLMRIVFEGEDKIYNVASGQQVSAYALIEVLRNLTGCELEYSAQLPLQSFPRIDITRLQKAFGFSPSPILEYLPEIIEHHRKMLIK